MTTLAGLVESEEDSEFSELVVLSKGLKKLAEDCDLVVPDTSFVANHLLVASEDNGIRSRMSSYIDMQYGNVNLFSLIGLYKDLSLSRPLSDYEETNLDEIHEGFDQNLLISELTLDALTSLLLKGKIAAPSQANDELDRSYNICLERTRIFKYVFNKMRANGYTSKMIDENKRDAYYFAEDRKEFFREQYRNYVKDFIKNTRACLEKLNIFIGLIKARDCIVEDSGLFKDADRRIIDGAMELKDGLGIDSVGIVSCDGHFHRKTKEVIMARKSSGLKAPSITLMSATVDFKKYSMRTY